MQRSKPDTVVLQVAESVRNERDQAGPTIYFDGSCPLCSAEIAHYASRKGGDDLTFVDVSETDADLGPALSCGDAMARFHVRKSDGTLLSGARAFIAVWAFLPGWRWAARIAAFPGVRPILELAYRAFLPIRPLLSKVAGIFGARAVNSRSTTG